jgi:hypothetical protein
MKRIKIKDVKDPKYKLGTIWTLTHQSKYSGDSLYYLIVIMDVMKIKRVRYRVLVIQSRDNWWRKPYTLDITEAKLEQYYFNESIWTRLPEKDLKFLIKFGNIPTGIVHDVLESPEFIKRTYRDVVIAETRLEKAKRKVESMENMRILFKEMYGTQSQTTK